MVAVCQKGREGGRGPVLRADAPTTAPAASFGPLRQDVAEKRIVLVLVDVVNPHVSLQIVWPRILVISLWTEWTDVARRIVDQAMANHFILPLEAFATFATTTARDRAVVRAGLAVDIGVRAAWPSAGQGRGDGRPRLT